MVSLAVATPPTTLNAKGFQVTKMRVVWGCLVGVMLASGCSDEMAAGPAPPETIVAQVISRRITDWDEFTGRFQAVESVEVRPRASGYIDQVLFREGQLVKKDEVLFVIDRRPYQADYDRARAGLALADSQYDLAKLEAERVQKLKDSGAVSREELDQRLSLLNQQEAERDRGEGRARFGCAACFPSPR